MSIVTGKPINMYDIRIYNVLLGLEYVKIGIFHVYDIHIFVTISLVKLRILYP